jgi:hypothetical protein
LEEARLYRGKKGGEGIAAVLNEEGKQVGLDPLGVMAPLYDDMKRYIGVVDELVARGVKSVTIYTHRKSFDLSALASRVGIDFTVFTCHKNTPYPVRDFLYDGRDPTDRNAWVIVDVEPEWKSESGAHPTLTEWNAHQQILERVEASGIRSCAVFSRILSEKSGKTDYTPNVRKMGSLWSFAKEISFSFAGCHPHNGEYVVWLSRDNQEVRTKNAWLPLPDHITAEGYAQMLVGVLCASAYGQSSSYLGLPPWRSYVRC